MAMYAIGTQPLVRRLDGITKQVWYADDSAAGSKAGEAQEMVGSVGGGRSTVWILSEWLQDTCPSKAKPY